MITAIYLDNLIVPDGTFYYNYCLDFDILDGLNINVNKFSLVDLFLIKTLFFSSRNLTFNKKCSINRTIFTTVDGLVNGLRKYAKHFDTCDFELYFKNVLEFQGINEKIFEEQNFIIFCYSLVEFKYLISKYDCLKIKISKEPEIFDKSSFDYSLHWYERSTKEQLHKILKLNLNHDV